jgi:hypothetical protein
VKPQSRLEAGPNGRGSNRPRTNAVASSVK